MKKRVTVRRCDKKPNDRTRWKRKGAAISILAASILLICIAMFLNWRF
uniref:Uncharacterized protein n=1 Tax=Candidatus Kentrum sp. TC TaxID=2126339 RepID=A0A450YYI2_9GAMM|nr:MAG: hypothetical protein BECKTC1821E_GA0114239_10674 [Candidatus Kentron sp. TC]